MQVLNGLDGLRSLPPGSVLSVGNFDGLHLGHRRLLELASELRAASPGAALALVTFEPHPLTVLRPEKAPPRLTPMSLKHAMLEEAGVEYLVDLPPSHEVLDVTAEEFWRILRDDVRAAHLVEGEDFNFGKGRGGNIQKLREWSAGSAVRLDIIDPVTVALLDLQVVPVSSSLIRWLLANGRVRDAAICLGHCYVLEGEVVRGYERGRTIGVPTANLHCKDQLVPMDGVYVGRCAVRGSSYAAAVSIGTMPTFGENQRQVEAHLLEFNGDIYGQTLHLEMVDWLRDQRRFDGVDELKIHLARDMAMTRDLAWRDPARAIASVA